MVNAPTEAGSPLDRVRIVLVEPQHPGNVGAAARAMRNMGLTRLVVVDPPAFDMERARWMAPGCDDVLDAAQLVGSLDEALAGVTRAVASTARHRKHGQEVQEPRQLAVDVLDAPPDAVTAILFGREDFGLSQADVARCERIVRIPTLEHASLNLGQAVLLVAHALFEEARGRGLWATGRMVGGSRPPKATASLSRSDAKTRRADLPVLEPAVTELVELLDRVGYTRGGSPDKVATTARGSLQRASLTVRQVEALRGMVRRVAWALDHPGTDWRAPSGSKD